MRLREGPFGIALRIYVVTVAAVLATGAALFLALALGRERGRPGWHGMVRDVGRYAAGQVAGRWASEPDVRREVDALSAALHLRPAVFRWDGTPVAGAAEVAPLSQPERDALAAAGELELGPAWGRRPGDAAFAIVSRDGPVGYVVVGPPPRPEHGPPFPPELIGLALVLVGGGVAAAVLGGSIARPLDHVARAARALGSGDFSARTGVARRDELGTVAHAFDDMADRVGSLMRGQTELIANVAHELRTPLARIRVALDLAGLGGDRVAPEMLAGIGDDLAELEVLVDDVLASARMDLAGNTASGPNPPLRRETLAVAAVVSEAVNRLRQRHPDRLVEVELAPGLPAVDGDAVLLRRAIENLLDNARKYSPRQAEIRVVAARRGEQVVVEVIDRGDGMSPEDLARLFTPFFRADRSRTRATGGVGLGLALSRRIVEAHGGSVVARSAPGVGTTMTISLPPSRA